MDTPLDEDVIPALESVPEDDNFTCDIEGDEDEVENSCLDVFSSRRAFYSSVGYHENDTTWRSDFVGLISAVSQVYRRGIYLEMLNLDDYEWQRLGEGTSFRVSSSEVKLEAFSTRNHRRKEMTSNKLVLKRNDYPGKMSPSQILTFVKELRVLDHLHDHPFIVNLHGIGWFNEYYNMERSHKPGILLEEAFSTLDHLLGPDVALAHGETLEIFAQITSGLTALHQSGVVHGDIKPGNILLFETTKFRDGVQILAYTAKLSDFGFAVFQDEGRYYLPPGTEGYAAPETRTSASSGLGSPTFNDILLTDAWSLGMLFAVLLWGSRDLLDGWASPDHVGSELDRTISKVNSKLESSSENASHVNVLKDLLKYTLQETPSDRRLDLVEQVLFQFRGDVNNYGYNLKPPEALRVNPESDLYISYEDLKGMNGPFKDALVAGLDRIIRTDDPRSPKALWELGVIFTSHFAGPDSSIEEGLQFIQNSAEAGDPRAKALCHRLHEAFGSQRLGKMTERQHIQWLEEAAQVGHQSALEDLRRLSPSSAIKAQALHAARFYEPLDDDDVSAITATKVISTRGDLALHRAAATGRIDQIEALLQVSDIEVNARNMEGDTPLIAACRFGQLKAVLLLLDYGADASIRNSFGENALHYAWCFNTAQSEIVVRRLISSGAQVADTSNRKIVTEDLDLLPILPGTALERAAGRARLDLVLLFLEHDNLLAPSNGALARRMLLWSLRLHDTDLQEYLVDSCLLDPETYDPNLAPMSKTTWLHRGEQRSLLDAACIGWVSNGGAGCNVPTRFWFACRHGKAWKPVIYSSIVRLMGFLDGSLPDVEKYVNRSIKWAFRSSLYDAFTALLRFKFESTPGRTARMYEFEALTWKSENNFSVMRPQEVYLIDQILYSAEDGGTLAAQAFERGDRTMFQLLTRHYKANAALPMPERKRAPEHGYISAHPSILKGQINIYSALTYTHHLDLWFAEELRRQGIPISCPWDESPFQEMAATDLLKTYRHVPPLLHALGTGSWEYVLWLLNFGASVEEMIDSDRNEILDAVMASRSRAIISFFFRGCYNYEAGAAFLPPRYREAGGYHVLNLYFKTRYLRHSFKFLGPSESSAQKSREIEAFDGFGGESAQDTNPDIDCYHYLVECYPEAENPGRPSILGVASRQHLSLSDQAKELGSRTVHDLKALIRARGLSSSEYPTQRVLQYIIGSPADSLDSESIAEVLQEIPGLNLRHFAPSILWPSSIIAWLWPTGSILGSLFLWYLTSGPPDKWDPDTWIFAFLAKLCSGVLVVSTLFGSLLFVVGVIALSGNDLVILWPVARPWSWASILVLGNILLPIVASLLLTLNAVIMAIRVKVQTGALLIPFIF